MNKLIRMTSLVVAATLASTPAFAATPSQQAKAKARIIKPLAISWVQDLDFGTIVLSGPGNWSGEVVSISQTGGFTCSNGNVTCSGNNDEAVYKLNGTNQQVVDITVSSTVNLENTTDTTAPDLVMTVDAPDTVTMTTSGAAGTNFGIGGSITLASTTVDGVYEGEFDVTADYQ